MISGGQAMLLGITRDSVFGPMMTVGFGGILTELLHDVSTRLLPVDASSARLMLTELRGFPLLDGFRGAPIVDRDALVDMMVALSEFMLRAGEEIAELELNPVLVGPKGVVAVDALVSLRKPPNDA
jgi:acyl-CoA synthetase (NDP forming)